MIDSFVYFWFARKCCMVQQFDPLASCIYICNNNSGAMKTFKCLIQIIHKGLQFIENIKCFIIIINIITSSCIMKILHRIPGINFFFILISGMYQVQFLNDHDFIELLKKTIGKNIGEGQCPITWNLSRSSLNFDWLERIWKFLAEVFQKDLERFQYLPLIPEKRSENEILMHALTENLLVGHLSENIALCLKGFPSKF